MTGPVYTPTYLKLLRLLLEELIKKDLLEAATSLDDAIKSSFTATEILSKSMYCIAKLKKTAWSNDAMQAIQELKAICRTGGILIR